MRKSQEDEEETMVKMENGEKTVKMENGENGEDEKKEKIVENKRKLWRKRKSFTNLLYH